MLPSNRRLGSFSSKVRSSLEALRILAKVYLTLQTSFLLRRPYSPMSFSSWSRRAFSKGRLGVTHTLRWTNGILWLTILVTHPATKMDRVSFNVMAPICFLWHWVLQVYCNHVTNQVIPYWKPGIIHGNWSCLVSRLHFDAVKRAVGKQGNENNLHVTEPSVRIPLTPVCSLIGLHLRHHNYFKCLLPLVSFRQLTWWNYELSNSRIVQIRTKLRRNVGMLTTVRDDGNCNGWCRLLRKIKKPLLTYQRC